MHEYRRRTRKVSIGLSGALCAVALMLAVLVSLMLARSHRAYEAQARNSAESIATLAQANVASELHRMDAIMLSVLDELMRAAPVWPPADEMVNTVLRSRRLLLPAIEGLRIADAQGNVKWGNDLPADRTVQIADRDYFVQSKAGSTERPVVAGPLQSRVSGHSVMALVRPIVVHGEFAGVLYATVTTDHFQALFERYDVRENDAITLRTDGLQLIARQAPGSVAVGKVGSSNVSDELRFALGMDRTRGVFMSRTALDGIERTTAYRSVEAWPLIVLAGLANERFFAPWRAQVWQVSSLALSAILTIAVALWAAYGAWHREALSHRALRIETRRVQALMRATADGIHIIDQDGRLVAMSDSFADLLGSTAQALLGRHVSEWESDQDDPRFGAWLSTVRDGDRRRMEVQYRREDGRVVDVELHASVADIEGDLLVFAAARDMTERKRLLASLKESSARVQQLCEEQQAMLDNELVGMMKLRDRVAMWKNRAVDRIFGYGPGELDGQPSRLLYPDDESYKALGRQAYPVLERGQHYRTQLQMRHKEGHLIWVDLNGVQLPEDCTLWMMVDITAMKDAQAHVEHIAFHDALTQLPNRLLLIDRMQQAIMTAQRSAKRVAVCYMDLDRFKPVNDVHGHDAGDAVLVEVARRLQGCLRPHDTAARVGGDEFVVLLTLLDEKTEWRHLVERLIAAVQQPIELPNGMTVNVGTSVGVALAPEDGMDPRGLLGKADRALLTAKRAGKGQLCVATLMMSDADT